MSNLKKDIREEILDILRWPYNKRPVRLTQSEALRQQRATDILNLIESVVDNLKPDTNLLGCDKHWSDDSGGTCTCDENERTAIRFYEKAKDDIKSKLIGKE